MKTFAFDLGRVIFDFSYETAIKRIKQRGASVEEIIKELFYNNFGIEFEKGLINSKEFYESFKQRFYVDIEFDEFKEIWSDIFSPIEDTISLIRELKKQKYPLYLISNINELHFDFLQNRWPEIFALFDHLVLSYKVKSVKPETTIYEILKTACDRGYEDIIYIDDRQDLIIEAKKLHLNCIQFTSCNQLVQDLSAFYHIEI